jgi:hypothetical protein
MNRTTLLAVALAALLAVTGAAAATPGSTAPADTGSGPAATDATDSADAAGQAGPPEELPDPVPDFVSNIHGVIQQFLDGTLDSLGPEVSEAAGNGDEADAAGTAGESTTDA